MKEPMPRSKKRKQPSSSTADPFRGIFTRSRSEIFLHRSRSGRSRFDPNRKGNQNIAVQWPDWCRRNPRVSNEEVFDNEIARISIKDLRARRVFSPASISNDCYSDDKSEIGTYADVTKPQLPETGGMDVEFCQGEPENNGDGGVLCGGEGSTEDWFQTTPPDTDVFCKSEVDGNEGNVMGFDFHCTEKPQLPFQAIGDTEISCRGDGSTEDCFQTTPPDTDVFGESEVELNGQNSMEFNLQSTDCISDNPSSKSAVGSNGGEEFSRIEMDKNNIPYTKSKMEGLIPCSRSRVKLFKTPGSFSYRRLLPFLIDLAKDNSSALEIRPCHKIEKSVEEKPVLPYSASSQNIPIDGANMDILPKGHPFAGLGSSLTEKSTDMIPSTGSSNIKDSTLKSAGPPIIEPHLEIPLDSPVNDSMITVLPNSCSVPLDSPVDVSMITVLPNSCSIPFDSPVNDSMITVLPNSCSVPLDSPVNDSMITVLPNSCGVPLDSPVNDSMITVLPNSCSECPSLVQQVMSDVLCELDPTYDAVDPINKTDILAKSSSSPISPELSSIESSVEVSSYLPIEVGEDCATPEFSAGAKALEALSFHQESSQVEALCPSEKLDVGPTRGILKRNPRGCRGLCSCLNCSSFRLHAERAFEFSRNQMQDAEEVAVFLMQELTCLRNLLEKCVNGSNDIQVKGACGNASRAEELAKSRLMQMNNDLNNHCRMTCLERPRVRFADYVEEKLIPKIETCPSKRPMNETKNIG